MVSDPQFDLERPIITESGGPRSDRVKRRTFHIAVAASGVDSEFLEIVEQWGMGVLMALVPRRDLSELKSLPINPLFSGDSPSLSVGFAGSLRPGSEADTISTYQAMSSGDWSLLTSPGPVWAIDLLSVASEPAGFPFAELWLSGTRPASGQPVVAFAELDPARLGETSHGNWAELAREFDFAYLEVDELIDRSTNKAAMTPSTAGAFLPTEFGDFTGQGFESRVKPDMTYLVLGGLPDAGPDSSVHIHARCLLGDTFGSKTCRCAEMLTTAIRRVRDGGGAIIEHDMGLGIVCPADVEQAQIDVEIGELLAGLNLGTKQVTSNRPIELDALRAGRRKSLATAVSSSWSSVDEKKENR